MGLWGNGDKNVRKAYENFHYSNQRDQRSRENFEKVDNAVHGLIFSFAKSIFILVWNIVKHSYYGIKDLNVKVYNTKFELLQSIPSYIRQFILWGVLVVGLLGCLAVFNYSIFPLVIYVGILVGIGLAHKKVEKGIESKFIAIRMLDQNGYPPEVIGYVNRGHRIKEIIIVSALPLSAWERKQEELCHIFDSYVQIEYLNTYKYLLTTIPWDIVEEEETRKELERKANEVDHKDVYISINFRVFQDDPDPCRRCRCQARSGAARGGVAGSRPDACESPRVEPSRASMRS